VDSHVVLLRFVPHRQRVCCMSCRSCRAQFLGCASAVPPPPACVHQVTVACLWAAFFNKLLLPWSTRDWALEQLSTALTAAAQVLHTTSTLQFAATAATNTPTSSGNDVNSSSSSSSSGGEDAVCGVKVDGGRGVENIRVVLAAALLQQESALQKQVVEPVVGVQTGETACMLMSDKGARSMDCLVLTGSHSAVGGRGGHVTVPIGWGKGCGVVSQTGGS
jgi:hypothetical protein